jgi:hypothetical protein
MSNDVMPRRFVTHVHDQRSRRCNEAVDLRGEQTGQFDAI